jgi:regulator of replication initiation timing
MAEDRLSPTEEIINQCVDVLKEEKTVKHAEAAAQWKAVKLKKEVKQYKTCCLVKSREIWDLYVNMDLCYVVKGYKKSELIKEDIKALCDKEKDMEQKLKDAVKDIKDIKTKLNEVVDEACKLDRCIKEEKRCKTGLHDQLKNDKTKKEWEEVLSCIEEHSVDCFNLACKAFDAGVDVIGIQTFVDMDSLKTLAADLEVKVTALRTDVKAISAKAEADWKLALEELLAVKTEIVTGRFEKCHAVNAREGIEDTIDFLCDPEGCENFEWTLDEICRKVKKNFGEGSEDPDHDDKDHGKDHRKDQGKAQGKDYDRDKPPRKPGRKDSEDENWQVD